MKFFNELIDMNSSKNSKIFVGLILVAVGISLVYLKVFYYHEITETLIFGVFGAAGGYFVAGIFTKNNTNPE